MFVIGFHRPLCVYGDANANADHFSLVLYKDSASVWGYLLFSLASLAAEK